MCSERAQGHVTLQCPVTEVGTSPTASLVQGGDDLSRKADSSWSEAFRPVYEALCGHFANNPCAVVVFLHSSALRVSPFPSFIAGR